jgi:hypothetical protein
MIRLSYKSSSNESVVLTLLSLLGATVFIFVAVEATLNTALIVLAVIGVFLLIVWASYRRKATEVFDCGDALLVRKGDRTERIPLTNIESIKFIRHKEPYVQLTLTKPGAFGKRIDFFDTHETATTSFWGKCQSDNLIALRARVENTTAQALRHEEKKDMRPWSLVVVGLFIAFLVVNSPAGPIETLQATVLESHMGAKHIVRITMQMDNGSTFETSAKQVPAIGIRLACSRQRHRLTRDFAYTCEIA